MPKEKKLKTVLVTPTGTLSYPWLREADVKFAGTNPDGSPAAGKYKCSIVVPEGLAIQLMGKLDALAEESFKAAFESAKPQDKARVQKAEPYKREYDEAGELTGNIIFHAKSNFKPKVVDSMLVPVPEEVTPYGGSTGRMSFSPEGYFMASTKTAGITLYLQGVQVFMLVTGGTDAGGNCGFSAMTEDELVTVPF